VLPRLLSPADDAGDPDRRRLAEAPSARCLPNPSPKLVAPSSNSSSASEGAGDEGRLDGVGGGVEARAAGRVGGGGGADCEASAAGRPGRPGRPGGSGPSAGIRGESKIGNPILATRAGRGRAAMAAVPLAAAALLAGSRGARRAPAEMARRANLRVCGARGRVFFNI
jgi:hypothetical protein